MAADRGTPVVVATPAPGRPPFAAYRRVAGAAIRSTASRPAVLAVRTAGAAGASLLEASGIAFAVDRAGSVAGWRAPEVVLLMGLVGAGQGLAFTFGERLEPRWFSQMVRDGRFDQVLTRPVTPLAWLLASLVDVRFLGRALAGGALIAWAGDRAGIAWTPANLAVTALAVLSTTAVILSLLVLGAALSFLTIDASELAGALTFGTVTVGFYPMHVYGGGVRAVFTWLVPIGLASYVPALVLLGREGPAEPGRELLWVAPVAVAGFAALAALAWRAGLRRYVGSGS